MQTLAETEAPSRGLTSAIWVAAALSAGSSLLHWLTTSTDTHSWSGDAAVSLVAGTGLMGLAMLLVARPWSAPTVRAISLLGAVGTAVVVIAVLLPLLSGAASGHAGTPGHVGHDVEGGETIAVVEVIRTTAEVALIGVLAWLHRATGRAATPRLTEASG